MRKPTVGKRARSRRIIMHAAKELFEERGIQHVTFNDIAERADMCRTTIFNHFATINELEYALVDQEVLDVVEFCHDSKEEGKELIYALFDKLIDDTVKYPVLASRLVSNAVIGRDDEHPLYRIEELVYENLPDMNPEEKDDRVVLLTGIYYGLTNHYFNSGKQFNQTQMTKQFRQLAKAYL